MKKRGRSPWTIRLTDDEKDHADRALEFIVDTEGFTGRKRARAEALGFIMDQALLGFPREETPTAHKTVLGSVQCPYLRSDGLNWLCDETIHKTVKRESAVLGSVTEPEIVTAKCLAHLRKKQEIQDNKIQELLAKQSIVKLAEFYKKWLTVSRDGLDVDCRMCIASLQDGNFAMSTDGKTLNCPKLREYVDIEKVCRQTVDLSKGIPPCEYFIEVVHAVTVDDMEAFKKRVQVEIAPVPCSAYGTSECPGSLNCKADLYALARINKYCPERYTPKRAVPMLESQGSEDLEV